MRDAEDVEIPAAEDPTEDVGPVGDPTERARKRKNLLYAGAGVVVLGGLGVLAWQMAQSEPRDVKRDDVKILATRSVASGNATKGEAAAEELTAKVSSLDQELATLNQTGQTLSIENQQLKQQLEAERANALATIAALERAAENRPSGPAQAGPAPATAAVGGGGGVVTAAAAPVPGSDPFAPIGASAGPMVAGEAPRARRSLATVRMGGSSGGENTGGPRVQGGGAQGTSAQAGAPNGALVSGGAQIFDTSRYVAPNAYVEARVLVGVDAMTGVTSNSDPKPVLFRITGPAVHVSVNGRRQTTDLTGCLVNGAAYGELSSEKVYIRLQRITCPAGDNRVSVATVEGYASHNGKAGVRGNVISREGGLTSRALVAGTLQGLGNSLSQYTNSMTRGIGITEGGLVGSPELDAGQVAAGAAGEGVAGAASMLADYYVKRAEQYQPVIEMPTGITVELVFLSGFEVARAPETRRR